MVLKFHRLILKILVISLFFFSVLTSCTKDDDEPVYSTLVSKEYITGFTAGYITNMIDLASGSIPEVSTLKSLVSSDIKIYKVVYKTTVKGNQVKVSGLVCVPSTPGDYPVLSFQNGTNTVNAYAPSESPLSFSYQLIETIASMGYVVVIADYPGFGESAQIPHPYLVVEPTVNSLVDILFAVKELVEYDLPDISLDNEYYLMGYSQGGWATLALHKSLELKYADDFNLKASVCGAGPYDILLLFQDMVNVSSYPMPVYLGYIFSAYTSYNQLTNPVSEIFIEPYASRINNLFNGTLTSAEINSQLTPVISDLLTPGFLSGFDSSTQYLSVRNAMTHNSITAWQTNIPLLLIHGEKDTHVSPLSTENMYLAMIEAGTSSVLCEKVIIPDVGHEDGAFPAMIKAIKYLENIRVAE